MENPGVLSLGDISIGAAAMQIGVTVWGLAGLQSVTLQARFACNGGGTSCKAYVQSSLDQGQTWFDIACFAFETAGGVAIFNVSAEGSVTSPVPATDGALADNTAVAGCLGDRLRVKVVSTGCYANQTLLSLWAAVR